MSTRSETEIPKSQAVTPKSQAFKRDSILTQSAELTLTILTNEMIVPTLRSGSAFGKAANLHSHLGIPF
jgi:hypothetical protein